MRHLAEREVALYDHLSGRNAFKERYAPERRDLVSLHAVQPSFKEANYQALDFTRRAWNKAARLMAQGRRLVFSAKPASAGAGSPLPGKSKRNVALRSD
jgi:hypothetical protein